MDFAPLTVEEVRVLGSLVEKALTTPDYYPLTLNALTNACNQLSNREPVVLYGEVTVRSAVETLRDKRLCFVYDGADSRVLKYGQKLAEILSLSPAELATLCILMLRGPQTVGEIRGRTGRLHEFASLDEVEATLAALIAHSPLPLVSKLPRQPGCKESRYAQLLSGPVETTQPASVAPAPSSASPLPLTAPNQGDRISALENEVGTLRGEISDLRQQLAELLKQLS